MIIFLDGQGRLVNKQQEDINQGSNLANIIYLVAPIPNTTQVLAYFTLPNSTVTKPRYVIAETGSPDIIKLGNENYNVWSLKLDAPITAYYGQASVTFCFISGEERLNSDLINFNISKGIVVKLPEDSSQKKALDDILALVSSIDRTQDNINLEIERVEGLTKQAQDTANKNKTDIENIHLKIDTLHANAFVIVDSLPEPTEEHLGKIYLVLSNASADSNYYDEYIVVKTNGYEWEKIGNTSIGENIDLSDYVKKEERDTFVKGGITTNTQTLSNEEKAAASEWLGSVLKTSTLGNQIYVSQNGVNRTIAYSTQAQGSTIACRGTKGELKVGAPIEAKDATPKEYVDKTTTEILNSVGLWVNEPVTFAEEVVEAYKTRKTANGLNGLIDGALTKVSKIQGKTVADGNTLKDSYFQGVKSTGKNWFNPDLLLVPNGWTENNGVYSGEVGYLYNEYKLSLGGLLKVGANGQITVSFEGKNATTNNRTFGVGFHYTDGTNTSDESVDWINSTEFAKHSATSVSGKTVEYIYVAYSNGDIISLKDFCVRLGTDNTYIPYEESSLMFTQRQELGEWDILDVQNKLKTTKTTKTTITDSFTINKVDDTTFTIPFSENSLENAISQNLVVTENSFALVEVSELTNGVYTGLVIQTNGATSLEDFKAMLQENPLTIAYEKKPTITAVSTLTITNDKYIAWVDGSETVIQGSVDNSSIGANPTITNTYAVEYGG